MIAQNIICPTYKSAGIFKRNYLNNSLMKEHTD